MTLHIDDCWITGPNQEDIDWVVQQIAAKFEIKKVDESKLYLEMKIKKQANENLAIVRAGTSQRWLEWLQWRQCEEVLTSDD